ncbi:MAG: type II toxin-antitoxin system RatA family toxin [Pseudomonadales bacterium]
MHISKSALLPYTASQLYELINDVESYPRFLDGCVGAEILRSEEGLMEARLDLQKKGIKQSFVTRNRLIAPDLIQMELLEGPLKSLQGKWMIKPLADQGCKLSLELDFEMKQGLIMQMVARFFGETANRLVDAICAEAARRYQPV